MTTEPAFVKPLSEADLLLRTNVYLILFFSVLLAWAGVWFTKIAPDGNAAGVQKMVDLKNALLTLRDSPNALISRLVGSQAGNNDLETNFKKIYLVAFLSAMLSDWLQGPYVYALYQAYGFSHADNGLLFIFGFGSSMLFGTFVGGYADRYGRKRFTLLYCVIYAGSCFTKHFNSFPILCFGRVLAGIATSLLYSVFESWLVCECSQRGFSDETLGEIFSWSIFGNSVVAICAGFVAQGASDVIGFVQVTDTFYIGKYCSPFDLAVVMLGCCAYFVRQNWTENYGTSALSPEEQMEQGEATTINGVEKNDFQEAFELLKKEKKLQYLGLMSGFFESSMFVFVFLWTPAITSNPGITQAPFGLIFSIFMLGCMVGSCLFTLLTTGHPITLYNVVGNERGENITTTIFGFRPLNISQCAKLIFVTGIVAHATVVFCSSSFFLILAFFLFEVAVGCYFPVMGIMKSKIVPEHCRSTMYNFFRVPLNFIVCCALLINLPTKVGFLLTSCMLGANVYLLRELGTDWLDEKKKATTKQKKDGEMSSMIGSTNNNKLDEGEPVDGPGI